MLKDIGRFRELPKWRKDFKSAWRKAMNTPITMPLNEKYRPDAKRFVCTCPQFVVSRFLICKHVVQLFHPVGPIFFLQVTRNRSTPFWSHPSLKPLLHVEGDANEDRQMITDHGDDDPAAGEQYNRENTARNTFEDDGVESDDEPVDIHDGRWESQGETFKEQMGARIQLIREFCDGLEHQTQFQDHRFLKTLEKEGAGFFRLAQSCLSRERRLNSSRAASPTTWESSTSTALFYRSRPRRNA
jgi:hypothetical protein